MSFIPTSAKLDREAFFWIYFVPLWTIPPALLILNNFHPLSIMLYYQVVFRLPHFVMTYLILNKKSIFSPSQAKTFVKFFSPPLAIIAAVYFLGKYDSNFFKIFIFLNFIIGFIHNNSQARGLSLMFLSEKSPEIVRIVKSLFVLLLLVSIEPMIVFAFGISGFFPPILLITAKILGAVLTAWLILKLVRKKTERKFLWYFLSSLFVLFPWSFYGHYVQQFLVHNLHHSLNYLGIGIASIAGTQVSSYRNLKAFKIYGACLAVSIIIGYFYSKKLTNIDNNFGFINCFFFVHYYLETRIWRDKNLNLKDIFLFKEWKKSTHPLNTAA